MCIRDSDGVVCELAPDVGYVNVDEMLITHPVRAPDPLDELAAGVGELGSFGQRVQQVELGAGQVHGSLPHVDLPGLRVKAQVSNGAHVWVSPGGGTHARSAKQAADAGGQLPWRKRFGHVVISPDGQADERVDLFAAGGEHDHVGVGEGTPVSYTHLTLPTILRV